MMRNPAEKYRPFPAVRLNGRRWPTRTIERAPIWMSTDLRDGNQALIEPMSIDAKARILRDAGGDGLQGNRSGLSVGIADGFRLRAQADRGKAHSRRRDHRSARAVAPRTDRAHLRIGGRRAAGDRAPVQRDLRRRSARSSSNQSKEEVKALAVEGTRIIKECAAARPDTHWTFQYSPETFSMTELSFSREVCDAVAQMWRPTPDHKMIVNLPATVEAAMPNVFADQIEWMDRNIGYRDSIVLSVHPHNDRGTAVAAAELAMLAGAERVEGCLFGNGERTGNVDLVTLAMNLYTQGIDPGLDFSDIDGVRRVVERCNQIPVHPRHPYAGDLVFTAFSGSHQDAIRKGFAQREAGHGVGRALSADRSRRSRPQLRRRDPREQPVGQGRRDVSCSSAAWASRRRAACRSSSATRCRKSPMLPARKSPATPFAHCSSANTSRHEGRRRASDASTLRFDGRDCKAACIRGCRRSRTRRRSRRPWPAWRVWRSR